MKAFDTVLRSCNIILVICAVGISIMSYVLVGPALNELYLFLDIDPSVEFFLFSKAVCISAILAFLVYFTKNSISIKDVYPSHKMVDKEDIFDLMTKVIISTLLIGLVASTVLNYLFGIEQQKTLIDQVHDVDNLSLASIVFIGFLLLIWAPISEEIVFRKLLMSGIAKFTGVWVAIVVSSLLFSLAHYNNSDFYSGFVERAILGVGLGYLYLKTGNIKIAMVMHMFINLGAFVKICTNYFGV